MPRMDLASNLQAALEETLRVVYLAVATIGVWENLTSSYELYDDHVVAQAISTRYVPTPTFVPAKVSIVDQSALLTYPHFGIVMIIVVDVYPVDVCCL